MKTAPYEPLPIKKLRKTEPILIDVNADCQSIVINAPASEIYRRVLRFEDLPRFLTSISKIDNVNANGFSCTSIINGQEIKSDVMIVMRVPEETSGSAHSTVAVDQYSGNVLQVHDFLTDSLGYRWIRFNRSIHTGDIWGLPGHIIVSVSSLLLVAMVITGLVIWWKKLAV